MLQLRGLSLDAPDGRILAEGLDLDVPEGRNLLVTGAGGSARGRLLRVIAGLERPRRGAVDVAGIPVWPGEGALALVGRVRMGFAFAAGGLLSNLSLADNLALPLRFQGHPRVEVARRLGAALARMGLDAVAGLRPHAVDAATRRRANLARVLALDPDLVLLDEPLEGLDATDRALALELIRAWAESPACTLVMTAEEAGTLGGLGMERLSLSPAPVPMESR